MSSAPISGCSTSLGAGCPKAPACAGAWQWSAGGLAGAQASAYKDVEAYPLDVLGAQTEGMIGYMIEQELGNLLPFEVPFATILTMVEVDPADPAFQNPTKFVGPVYEKEEADRLKAEKGWVFKQDGASGAGWCPPRCPSGFLRSGRSNGCWSMARS